MRTDSDIRRCIQAGISAHAAEGFDLESIAIKVDKGAVSLEGNVATPRQKSLAEREAARTDGVVKVVNELKVLPPLRERKDDQEIWRDAAALLMEVQPYSSHFISLEVRHGRIKLTGDVDFGFQSRRAERAARHVDGVNSVANCIAVRRAASVEEIQKAPGEAMIRDSGIDAARTTVDAAGKIVVAKGMRALLC